MKSTVSVPGKKGAIARLIVLCLLCLIGVASSFLTLPHYIGKIGLFPAVQEAFASCGILFMFAFGIWAIMKWLVVVAPKSFGAAKRFWFSWEPLTFFGLYIKACIWVLIALTPCAVCTMFITPLTALGMHFLNNANILYAFGLFFGGIVLVVFVGILDICKARGFSLIDGVKRLFGCRKAA